jgi:hypothetical protein
MKITSTIVSVASSALVLSMMSTTALAQRGSLTRGGGGGARSAGYRAPGVGANLSAGPSMSRPGGGGQGIQRPGGSNSGAIQRPSAGGLGGIQRPGVDQTGGIQRPGAGDLGGVQRPGVGQPGGTQRPSVGNLGGIQRPNAGQPGGMQRPGTGDLGGIQRPNAGQTGGVQRPGAGDLGGIQRPGAGGLGGLQRPGGGGGRGPSSDALQDFLGGGGSSPSPGNRLPAGIQRPAGGLSDRVQRPGISEPEGGLGGRPGAGLGARTNIGDRTNIGTGSRTNIGVGGNTTNVNIGNVNVGNRVSFANNRQAWISQRQNWGNNVRTGIGRRYNSLFNTSFFRGGFVTGGFRFYRGWVNRGPYFAWRPLSWAAFGSFLGGPWATVQPVFFAYGQGGNIYFENNVVYVNGQPAGTPEQYFQQIQALAATVPAVDQLNAQEQDWLPLGVFALTSEDTGDSQILLQLAVNKQGVIAGTYYNEASQVSRPIQGIADIKTQRAVISFADGKNTDRILETGINNLTEDEAPALLHYGAEESQPVLLVRLKPPEDEPASQ